MRILLCVLAATCMALPVQFPPSGPSFDVVRPTTPALQIVSRSSAVGGLRVSKSGGSTGRHVLAWTENGRTDLVGAVVDRDLQVLDAFVPIDSLDSAGNGENAFPIPTARFAVLAVGDVAGVGDLALWSVATCRTVCGCKSSSRWAVSEPRSLLPGDVPLDRPLSLL